MTTIRVSETTWATIHALAAARGESINEVAEKAVELFRRQQLLETTNAAYATLRCDPEAWQELQAEGATLDGTLADGLEAYSY